MGLHPGGRLHARRAVRVWQSVGSADPKHIQAGVNARPFHFSAVAVCTRDYRRHFRSCVLLITYAVIKFRNGPMTTAVNPPRLQAATR